MIMKICRHTLTLSQDLACISEMPVRLLPLKNENFDPKFALSMYMVIDCKNLHLENQVLFVLLFIFYLL